MDDYRKQIYDRYSTVIQGSSAPIEDKVAERWGRAYAYYFRKWLPLSKDATIFDLACGSGTLLRFFKERGYGRVSGIDISAEQASLSRKIMDDVVEGDVLQYLRERRGEADLIIGLDIVEHFHKDEAIAFLTGCYLSLAAGGRVILQTPNACSPWGSALRYADFTHETCFTPGLLTKLLTMCGFRDVESREMNPIPWRYSLTATVRYVCWRMIRVVLMLWNFVETGNPGEGIYTRVFLVSARK
jgi:cyclopropane fatty-acyl-phospholipid synthase-like methyltransferase